MIRRIHWQQAVEKLIELEQRVAHYNQISGKDVLLEVRRLLVNVDWVKGVISQVYVYEFGECCPDMPVTVEAFKRRLRVVAYNPKTATYSLGEQLSLALLDIQGALNVVDHRFRMLSL